MVLADRAYAKIIDDGQKTFVAMQREYYSLLQHCQELSTTVAAQGLEIYGDGRRIDELDQYILDGSRRAEVLDAQQHGMKNEYDTLLQAESTKLFNARRELDAKNAELKSGYAAMQQFYSHAKA